ncbi:hydantoinase B/oxoprolinase family protein [Siccirubricoccus sp. KC 17139]|uniref:Hydantoinase B/oxoprolinase family protein n=1 Tax=Siccirubricoccus soli TaxID=2899147 RepID=A0ABT1DBF0_9PROT|nr:hydantoinase B/oxoprolinase family protein [Siccirubricoccus soli]MCO6419253.1 hydantoinase B/oxoprolinase family protein [Siccirubricoccus soli]MCP2685388.1 hydantoinase B/oxoprolinase family protein [Siccirubricoccus soli]
MTAHRLDPASIEIIRRRLDAIAEEMQAIMLRSAVSPIVREANDASASLFLPDGTVLAQSNSLPLLLGCLVPAVGRLIREFPVAAMRPGDIYLMNDPYDGGTHIPDVSLLVPVFAGEEVIALSATILHHQDMGGLTPGSVPTSATEIFHEGLRLPPLQLAREGVVDAQIMRIISRNIRTFDAFEWDLNAQISACRTGAARLAELAAKHGAAPLTAMLRELVRQAEMATRAAIAALPDGTWVYEDQLDNDGVELDRPVPLRVAVTVAGDSLTIDFTGTSPQVRGPVNAAPAGVMAGAFFALRAVTGPDIPNNGGCFRPLRLVLPEGSLVNPRMPAAVNARTATVKVLTNAILGALAAAAPERIPAPNAAVSCIVSFGGRRADGSPYVVTEVVAGGSGGSAFGPGVNGISTDVSNTMNQPAEMLESDAPLRVHRVAVRRGSGGAGRHPGGCGILREYEVLHGPLTLSFRGERHLTAPRGALGGGPGRVAEAYILRRDGGREEIRSKLSTVLHTGDRLVMGTAGAGGWGAPP